ncbi:MAG: VWA domain-containing protein, partial [Acidobacteria bacterium]|nr:VWA domain-containing protein [Acidobacteriota bacterium]
PAAAPRPADPAVRQTLSAPRLVFPGERFDARVLLTSARPGPVVVDFFRNDVLDQSRSATLAPGVEQEEAFPLTAPPAGPLRLRTQVRRDDGAASPAGEARLAVVEVAPPLAVEYVAGSPEEAAPLPAILRRAGMRVAALDPDGWLRAAGTRPGVIVLDDVPVEALGEEGMARLEQRVRAGAGLLVVGGVRGFGSGEYRGTQLERILPATAGPPPGGPDADVGLAIVLDASLSMFFRGRGASDASGSPRKIEVARLAVLEVVRALRPNDRIGLLASNDRLTWIRRPALLDDREAFEARVASLGVIGGGINFYSSIREAAESLREQPTRLRHVMVVADADDVDQLEILDEGRSEELVRTMAGEGVTLSIFAIGYPSDKDVLFLKRMTSLGRGDFYLVPDLGNLPRFFRAEYQRRTGEWFREGEFVPLVRDFNPLLRGLDPAALPAFGGLSLVAAKTGAEEILIDPAGAPVLALWGYGRGRAAVFSPDSGGRWAAGWAGWGEAERFWSQTLQALAAAPEPPAVELRAEADRRGGFARFTLRGGSGAALPAGPASVSFEGGAPQPLLRRGVERFEAPLPPAEREPAAFTVAGPWAPAGAAALLASPVDDAGREAVQARAALDALVAGSGGAWLDRAGDLERHVGSPPARRFDPVFWLLLGALTALAGEILLRE